MPLITNPIVIGQSPTASQNFRLQSGNDGTLTLARNADGSGGNILTVASDGDVKLKKTAATSMVRLNTANGYGSTNTKIRRFTNTVTNQGTDITYADSATLGASFTINTDGVYAVSYSETVSAGTAIGISLNSSQLTIAIDSINVADILSLASHTTSGYSPVATSTLYLSAGAVIRPHTNGAAAGGAVHLFTITRVA